MIYLQQEWGVYAALTLFDKKSSKLDEKDLSRR